jgi:hypothetical protein
MPFFLDGHIILRVVYIILSWLYNAFLLLTSLYIVSYTILSFYLYHVFFHVFQITLDEVATNHI